MPDACPTCGSTQGFYDGPNNVPRCSKCFADLLDWQPQPQAQAKPAAKASDKAMRGPKEPT